MKKTLKKIVTIGPVYPFRGGIAQYGSLLIRELEKTYELQSISFSMMYPKFLYPGKSQKDYSTSYDIKSEIKYFINSINPFSYIKTARYINRYMPDLVIIHWWQPFFAFADIGILKLLKKNIKVCICCNNVLPHDKIPFSRWLTRQVLKQGDMYMVHSIEEEEQLFQLLSKEVSHIRIPCPDISTFVKTGMDKEEARKQLELSEDDKVIMFFGFVRKYKGLYHLFNIMPELIKKVSNIKLLVVGDFYEEKEGYFKQIEENNLQNNIFVYDEFIPDSKVEPYFVAADAVILPYDSATTSGVIQAAYNFDRPVIVTDVGGLKEAVVTGQTGYVVASGDEAALRDKIQEFFDKETEIDYPNFIEQERYKYSWTRVVESIQEMWSDYED